MKVYDYRNGALRAPLAAMEADVGPYRLRHSQDAVWPPKERAYGGTVDSAWQRAAAPALATLRLILPVTLLVTLLAAAYLYSDALITFSGAPRIVNDALLAISDLILPVAWFAIHLCNRRYGAAYAFVQLVAALTIFALVALVNPGDLDDWISNSLGLSWRAVFAFGAAFLLSGFAAIIFFDAARGPRWWTAPLAAALPASLAFSAVYYPAAFAGAGAMSWTDSALVHFGVFFAESLLLLIPYYLMRPAMKPMPGMNGY